MSNWIRNNVLGLVAIFIALGGTTYAANKVDSGDIDKNAVKAKHIGTGQVKTAEIGDGQVGTADLADNSVTSPKVASNSLTGEDVNESTLGQVPSAANADTATRADSATTATSATTAGSAPPSGAAGGELAGTYPNPTVGTVAGLDLASSTSPSEGINFGSDTSLFRTAPNALQSNDSLNLFAPPSVVGLYLESATAGGAAVISEGGGPPGADTIIDPARISLVQPDPGSGFLELEETTGVNDAPSGSVQLIARDNAGTTELVAVFSNEAGAEDISVLAADPNNP